MDTNTTTTSPADAATAGSASAATNAASEATPAPRQRTSAPAKPKTFTAKLVRGENYAVRDKETGKVHRFKRGVPVPDLPEHLRSKIETAADESTITDGDGATETLLRKKFEIVG